MRARYTRGSPPVFCKAEGSRRCGSEKTDEGAICNSLIGFIGTSYRGSGLLAGDLAIEVHHRGNPVVERSVAGIAFLHRQLADLGDLSSRLLCSALEFSRCRNGIDVAGVRGESGEDRGAALYQRAAGRKPKRPRPLTAKTGVRVP